MSGFYNPAAFRADDPQRLGDLIDATVFATLLSNAAGGPSVSHVPVLLDRQAGPSGTLRAHLARANEHWLGLDGEPVLVIFHGPQHYVSPSWYASKAQTARVVPTWNYVVVHVRGRARVHQDRGRLRGLIETLTQRMEAPRQQPWQVADAPADYLERMIDQIVGVDVHIESMEGKLKLGQNRSPQDRSSLAAGLARERPELFTALEQLVGLEP